MCPTSFSLLSFSSVFLYCLLFCFSLLPLFLEYFRLRKYSVSPFLSLFFSELPLSVLCPFLCLVFSFKLRDFHSSLSSPNSLFITFNTIYLHLPFINSWTLSPSVSLSSFPFLPSPFSLLPSLFFSLFFSLLSQFTFTLSPRSIHSFIRFNPHLNLNVLSLTGFHSAL